MMARADLSRRGFLVGGAALTACAPAGMGGSRAPDAKGAYLLLPLSGSMAEIGQDMARAATLAAPGAALPTPFDTGEDAETAGEAARQAKAADARMILGPLRADQVPAVLQVAGSVPVVTFSNDETLTGSGAFILGVTPAQSVATMFSYARAQGAKRVAVVAADTPYGRSTAIAAQQIATAGGLNLSATLLRDPKAGGLAAALRAASGGVMPEAVFIPDRGAALQSFARGLRGTQLMGGMQWGLGAEADALSNPDLDGAWYAAPPPEAFQNFADRFEAAFGSVPGYVAALGHDAAIMALTLSGSTMSRKGILRSAGFSGALGRFRFLPDGRCKRDLSVLGLNSGQVVALGEVSDT
jgi:branched-chain amino acid transport system substrate-binding protein